MAISDVAIANLALQKLGSGHITSLSQDDPSARAVNACYEQIRDMELRKHPWNFARKRTTLAPDATTPSFDFDYAFPLPSDCLRSAVARDVHSNRARKGATIRRGYHLRADNLRRHILFHLERSYTEYYICSPRPGRYKATTATAARNFKRGDIAHPVL